MKNKRKNIIILLILILLLTLGIGVTYAIFKWTSSNSDITFNIEGCYVTYDAGGDITGASLGPALSKDDTNNVLSKKITLSPECSGVTANLTLKVNEIAPELKHTSFVWSLYEGDTKVSSGNFADATTNKVYTLLSTKTLTENTTTTYTLYIYIDGTVDNDSSMGGKSFKFTLGASGENALYKGPPGADYIASLDDGTTGDSGSGVYKITHSAIPAESSATGSEIPAVNDYRYYGASPNNYVCLDMEGQSICPDKNLFRMIGSIYEENASQNLIKVIKATALTAGTNGNFSWDYKVNNRFISYNNIWSTTTSGTSSGAILMQILNDIYLTKGTRDYYFPISEADDYQIFSVSFADTGLSAVAQNLINSGIDNKLSRYYLGGFSSSNLKINTIYSAERGRTTSNGNALYWDGKVGLMYPSDYGYAAGNDCVTNTDAYSYDKCSDKNWIDLKNIYELFMTSVATSEKLVFNSDRFGKICEVSSSTPRYARPVFYLSSDVSITSGTGTSSDPYLVSK